MGTSARSFRLCGESQASENNDRAPGKHTNHALPALLKALATAIFRGKPSPEKMLTSAPRKAAPTRSLEWCNTLHREFGAPALTHFLACCTGRDEDFHPSAEALGAAKGSQKMAQLLSLRGLLGGGVLIPRLSQRHRVDYGINFKCAAYKIALRH
jgi:hypothetical protein